jgi:predicted membrane-bound mannosyltransferase
MNRLASRLKIRLSPTSFNFAEFCAHDIKTVIFVNFFFIIIFHYLENMKFIYLLTFLVFNGVSKKRT